jgi:hypothetical protein
LPVIVLIALVPVPACDSRPDPNVFERYKPASALARSSLISALNAWKSGASTGRVPETKPVVYVIDTERPKEPALVDIEVISETPAPTARCFNARLTFADMDQPVLTRFYLFGIDPIWIYRQKDFDMLSHWEHPMEPDDRVKTVDKSTENIEESMKDKHSH